MASMTLWHSQWKLFAPQFYDGKAHIDLSAYGGCSTLQLLPGPGFGDFSHPTTRLTLQLMAPHVQGQHVIDIGCGSGILALAAKALGAKSVYGYDIDPDAASHAQKNAALNGLSIQFATCPPRTSQPSSLLLMNMIASEQASAWSTFLPFHAQPYRLFTSGILDKTAYLAWAQHNNWTLLRSLQEQSQDNRWWAFEFISS